MAAIEKKRSYFKIYSKYGWIYISIAVILLMIFMIYPIIDSLVLSTKDCKGIVCKPNGLGNVNRAFNDKVFIKAFFNTITFFFVQVPIMLILAIILATLLNNKKIRFRGFFRTAIFLPTVTSLVAYSILFKMMFGYEGIINQFLMNTHIINAPIPWLTDSFWAKVTIIIALLWRWTGYNMIFYLAALQNVDSEIYEAADVDGANRRQKLFLITLPLLKPIILFTAIMSTIGTLQLFDEPMNLTRGGPSNATLTISQYIYNQSFVYVPNFGYAATLSYVIVFIVAILTIIQFKVAGDE